MKECIKVWLGLEYNIIVAEQSVITMPVGSNAGSLLLLAIAIAAAVIPHIQNFGRKILADFLRLFADFRRVANNLVTQRAN